MNGYVDIAADCDTAVEGANAPAEDHRSGLVATRGITDVQIAADGRTLIAGLDDPLGGTAAEQKPSYANSRYQNGDESADQTDRVGVVDKPRPEVREESHESRP